MKGSVGCLGSSFRVAPLLARLSGPSTGCAGLHLCADGQHGWNHVRKLRPMRGCGFFYWRNGWWCSPALAQEVEQARMDRLAKYPAVVAACESPPVSVPDLVDLCVAVQQIPAPTGDEGMRAEWVAERFAALGLKDVERDRLHNVIGRVPGARRAPALLVSAHTDTVFGRHVDLSVRRDDGAGRIYGPGIGDNSTGVAALLALAEIMQSLPTPPVDIWFAANSNEEGLGDLKGMRAVFDRLGDEVGACIVIEGMGLGRIVHRGLGSRRFRIHVEAPGGHSWSDFGAASALHVLVQLAAQLTHLRPPESPRTTFNIGRMGGGTSVNSIAQHAWLELDLRSEDQQALQTMIEQVLAIAQGYQTTKLLRRGVSVKVETIGDRPPGEIPADHPLVKAAVATLRHAGYEGMPDLRISSTDANIPLHQGIPAVCIGVTEGGNAHRLSEWIQTRPLAQGMRHLLLLTWWAADWLNEG